MNRFLRNSLILLTLVPFLHFGTAYAFRGGGGGFDRGGGDFGRGEEEFGRGGGEFSRGEGGNFNRGGEERSYSNREPSSYANQRDVGDYNKRAAGTVGAYGRGYGNAEENAASQNGSGYYDGSGTATTPVEVNVNPTNSPYAPY